MITVTRWPAFLSFRPTAAAVLVALVLMVGTKADAQPAPAVEIPEQGAAERPSPDELADEALADPAAPPQFAPDVASVDYLQLFFQGGWLMAPIVLMSLIVAAVAIERFLGLRRSHVAPRALTRGLRQMAELGDFEPRAANRMCEAHPSSLARVVTAVVSKAGRPHGEVEAAAADALQRESDRLYSNVRTLNLAAAVTPLMGLLGTVWGMIAAFFATATLPLGSNKGQALAEGIYVALVTTFAGLAVAIPAAMLAHYFEGRILRLLRSVEELLLEVLPRLERFEGGPRISLIESGVIEESASLAHGGSGGEEPNPDGVDWPHPGPMGPHGTLTPDNLTSESPTQSWHS